jgi:hypothetical protein
MKRTFTVLALTFLCLFLMSNKLAAQELATYGFFADDPALTLVGDFLTDIPTAEIDRNDDATYRIVTHPDSVYAGDSSLLVNFGGGKSDKVRFAVDDPVDFSQFNTGGEFVFFIKLLDTLDFSIEIDALRDGQEVNGSDESLEEEHGLNRFDLTKWQEFRVEMDSIAGTSFDYSQFRRIGFRSRYNASSFLVDEIFVEYETVGGIADAPSIPDRLMLSQNYPNPFNPSTIIEFSLPKSEFVELKVYNLLGKEIATLVSDKLNQGDHIYTFDGQNLASGVYYYRIEAGEYQDVKKMILLR